MIRKLAQAYINWNVFWIGVAVGTVIANTVIVIFAFAPRLVGAALGIVT